MALSKLARTRSVRVSGLTRLSSVSTTPVRSLPASASGRAVTGAPASIWRDETLGHAEVDEDARAVVEGRDLGLGADLVADVDAEDADPAVERCPDHPVLECELGVADRKRRLLGGERALEERHLVDRAGFAQLPAAREGGGGVGRGQAGAVEGDLLGLGIEADERARRP